MSKMTYNRVEKCLLALACLEIGMSLLSLGASGVGLVEFTMRMKDIQMLIARANGPPGNPGNLNPGTPAPTPTPAKFSGQSGALVGIAIKSFYFIMLFFLAEVALAVFLIHIIRWKNLRHLNIWFIIICTITVLYITDFLSTLHGLSFLEDVPVTLGIFIKVPLCLLGYKYRKELNKLGDSFNNSI